MLFRTSCICSVCRTLGVVFGEPTDPKQYGSAGAPEPAVDCVESAGVEALRTGITRPAGLLYQMSCQSIRRGAMQMSVTVYTKPACVQCNATYKALDKAGIAYDVIDISVDSEARDYVMALGYLQAPV